MFGWLKRRQELEAAQSRRTRERFNGVRTALATIGVKVTAVEPEIFVAEAATAISKHLCKLSRAPVTEDNRLYAAAVFAMIATDQLARMLNVRFETSADLSVARLVGGKEHIHDRAIDRFYRLSSELPMIVQSVSQSLVEWIDRPTSANLDSLVTAFDLLRNSSVRHGIQLR